MGRESLTNFSRYSRFTYLLFYSMHNLRILKQFANSVFKIDGKLPSTSGKPSHIHLKEGAVPKPKHKPIPLPYHLKEPVR